MIKSQYDSTDIYSDEEESSMILLKIEGIDPKWAHLFLNSEGSDFKIYHQNTFYTVHRSVIFKQINLHVLDDQISQGCLHVPDSLKVQLLTGVISVLYGLQLRIYRNETLKVLDVIHFLKISKLKKLVEEDIISNFEEYELFPLMEKARMMSMQQIEQMCLKQLEFEGYEQMRYGKYELLSCDEDLFKFIVHKHNQRRWQDPSFGQTDKFIQELIQQYCKHNSYTERKKSLLLKSFNQLSIKSDIPLIISDAKISPLKLKEENQINIRVYTPRIVHTESMMSPMNYFKSVKANDCSKSMIMDLSFMSHQKRKKVNRPSQHNSSQSKLCIEMISLKQEKAKQGKEIQELKDKVQQVQKRILQRQAEAQNNKFRLSEIEQLLQECQRQVMENNRYSRLLEVRFKKIQQRKIKASQLSESDEQNESPEKQQKKSESAKDQKLKVSLTQSRWICC